MEKTSVESFKNKNIQGYLKAKDIYSIVENIETMNDEINSLISGDIYDEVTAAQLVAKRTASELVPLKAYKITDLSEPLVIYALAINKLGFWAYSPSFPQDAILYNTSDASSTNWKIVYRKDTINSITVDGTDADFRGAVSFIGAGCRNIEIRNRTSNNITLGANCFRLYIDMGVSGNAITVSAGTTDKRLEVGFSNFEESVDINGLSIIDLTGKKHCGIINITSSSESDTETVDSITNASGNHHVIFRPAGTLTLNWRDLGISGGNLKLEVSPTTTDGESLDFIEFEKIGNNLAVTNVRNYLPILVSP